MNKLAEQIIRSPYSVFDGTLVDALSAGSRDQRYGLMKRAIAGGDILHIRRGLYCLAPQYQRTPVNPYAVSQQVYGPSYVSLESALAWHGWIPEAVYGCTCASYRDSREFETPLGLFSYRRVPQKTFYAGVERLTDAAGNVFLMARPTKALADYVYVHKLDWTGVRPAAESLRIEPDEFKQITGEEFDVLAENYRSRRVRRFIEGLRKDLTP
jgi:predicted transcriptional regulator of viral defense system